MKTLVLLLSLASPELLELYEAKHFFTLRDRLTQVRETEGNAQEHMLRAAVALAFNELATSEAQVARGLAVDGLDDATRLELLRLSRGAAMRRHDYRAADEAARGVLDLDAALSSTEDRRDDENMARVLSVLSDVPPQEMRAGGDTSVRLSKNKVGGLRVPIRVNGQDRAYLFDSGANLSVMMRSETEALGLRVRPAGIEVGSSTGDKVSADLAVADELVLGNHLFRNVVFLVFPDALLTIPQVDLRLEGIIGFPVFEAMGEVRFSGEETLFVPAEVPRRQNVNLALDLLDPLVQVRYRDSELLCRLDSGASSTDLYEPFFRAHRGEVERLGESVTFQTAGVGSKRDVPGYKLLDVALGVGGQTVRLEEVSVFTERLAESGENHLDCNIGQDVLRRFDTYLINFVSMTFLLE